VRGCTALKNDSRSCMGLGLVPCPQDGLQVQEDENEIIMPSQISSRKAIYKIPPCECMQIIPLLKSCSDFNLKEIA
jgi:hypothetical protein